MSILQTVKPGDPTGGGQVKSLPGLVLKSTTDSHGVNSQDLQAARGGLVGQ